MNEMTVAIAGLGAIGLSLARSLDRNDIEGFRLAAVTSRDIEKAKGAVADFASPPPVVGSPAELTDADIVIEAAPAAAFVDIARPAIAAGKILVACSGGALMRNMGLVEEAEQCGARIIVPTGALIGLDAVRAAAQGTISSSVIETRKAPKGWSGAPTLSSRGSLWMVLPKKSAFSRAMHWRQRLAFRPTSTSPRHSPLPE